MWIDAKDATKSGYLDFYVAIDRTNIGFFTVTSSYKEPVVDTVDVFFTDDYTGNTTTFVLHEINVLPALVTLRLKRSPINIVFPMFIAIGLWMMVAAQVLAFLPFYMGLKYVDAYAVPIAAVSTLFAVPAIRNNMPGVPPLGCIIDFASYFFVIVIATFNLLSLGILYMFFSHQRQAREKAKKVIDDDQKRIVNKGLKKLSVEEVAVLFEKTGRSHLVDAVHKSSVDGKVLAAIKNKADLEELDLRPLEGSARIRLMNDIESWASLGVEADKITKAEDDVIRPER